MQELVERLRRRGFDAHAFSTGQEAAAYLFTQIAKGASVGVGGSVTVREMGLAEKLREEGHKVWWHWDAIGEEVAEALEGASRADVYLCSANAITRDGVIVNIDGNGNRIAATVFGPREVFFLVGRNKICEDIPSALRRVKDVAASKNARRLNAKTPCATTGKCENCLSPTVLCGATMLLERPTMGRPMHVLMIGEELGF